jgi:hypothetical protein
MQEKALRLSLIVWPQKYQKLCQILAADSYLGVVLPE